ncbi:hypothetical protein HYU19_06065 [Candidatus Woesearchaeota archaeon]|nr:hypothetical protein [Candidatus Woesearchaeota archaeon]
MGSFTHTIKKYYPFSAEEIKALAISILGMAFIISYNDWGGDVFNFWLGIRNLFSAILIVTLGMLAQQTGSRVAGFSVGIKTEYKLWVYGIVIGLAACIVSKGRLWFLAPGGILMYHMAGHRLGSFRYGLNFWPQGLAALSGSLASLVLAMLFKALMSFSPENPLLQEAMLFNIWFGLITLLPIPPLNGSHLFFSSRIMYTFSIGVAIGLAASLYFLGVFLSLLIGLLVGAICFIAYNWVTHGDPYGGH